MGERGGCGRERGVIRAHKNEDAKRTLYMARTHHPCRVQEGVRDHARYDRTKQVSPHPSTVPRRSYSP